MEELDLKDLFQFYKARVSWIIIAVLACVAMGNLYRIITRTPMYKSETTISIVNNKNVSLDELSEIVKSRNVLEKVISNLDLDYSYSQLKPNVSANSVAGNTKMLMITAKDKSSKQAEKIANETREVFVKGIKEIYNIGYVKLVDKAVESSRPYNLNFKKDNIMFIGIGLFISCGLIFSIYYFDTSIKTVDEIENRLGLAVIGTVPRVSKEK